jgi:hypothetical protein
MGCVCVTGIPINFIYLLSTPNTVANVRHAWLYECTVCAMQKKLKLSSDGGDSVARNTNEAVAAPMAGLAESAFGGSLETGGWCVW